MADSFALTDGVTTIELVYDSASQSEYRLRYGASIQLAEPDVLMHNPDFAESVPVRGVDQNRTAFFNLHLLPNTDWDTIHNSVTAVKRMVDGANSQALRYWTDGDVNRVVLRVQLDGMTNYTDIPIKIGVVDDSGSYYTPLAILNKIGDNVGVILTVGPYGEGASIALANAIASSPHCVEDSDSDGIANGWFVTGTPTTTIDTTAWLIGGKSQKVVTDNSTTEGINTPTATLAISSALVAYVWIYIETGGDQVQPILRDGAGGVVDSALLTETDSGGVSDKTAVDEAGNTWYRVPLTGTNSGNANAYIEIRRQTGDASAITTYYCDGAYIAIGAAVPDAWCGTLAIENQYAPTVAEANINYWDTWGIPGDADALVDLTLASSTGQGFGFYGFSYFDGVLPAASTVHWIESENMSKTTATTATETTGGDGVDAHYWNLPSGQTSGLFFGNVDWDYLRYSPTSIHAVFRASDSATTIQARIGTDETGIPGGVTLWTGEAVGIKNTNTWEIVDLGVPNLTELQGTGVLLVLELTITKISASTAFLDGLFVLPTAHELTYCEIDKYGGSVVTTYTFYTEGGNRVIRATSDKFLQPTLGDLWHVKSGNISTRFVFVFVGQDKEYDLGTGVDIVPVITPRTRHLLGVK